MDAPFQEVDGGIRTRWGVMLAEPLISARGGMKSFQKGTGVLSGTVEQARPPWEPFPLATQRQNKPGYMIKEGLS